MRNPAFWLALLGVLLVVAGVGLWSVPAAMVTAGVLSMFAAYVVRYLEVQR